MPIFWWSHFGHYNRYVLYCCDALNSWTLVHPMSWQPQDIGHNDQTKTIVSYSLLGDMLTNHIRRLEIRQSFYSVNWYSNFQLFLSQEWDTSKERNWVFDQPNWPKPNPMETLELRHKRVLERFSLSSIYTTLCKMLEQIIPSLSHSLLHVLWLQKQCGSWLSIREKVVTRPKQG